MCDKLLAHYTCQYRDRQIYFAARNRSACEKDLLCIIVDSFDKAKLSLPKYPYARTPKRTIYENTLRTLDDQSWQDNFVKKGMFKFGDDTKCFSFHPFSVLPQSAKYGASLLLTAVMIHGRGLPGNRPHNVAVGPHHRCSFSGGSTPSQGEVGPVSHIAGAVGRRPRRLADSLYLLSLAEDPPLSIYQDKTSILSPYGRPFASLVPSAWWRWC